MPAFREATWEEALDLVARRIVEIRETHGGGALAGFGSAKCSNEEAYLFQKMVRAGFETNNVDHCIEQKRNGPPRDFHHGNVRGDAA